MGRLGHTPAFRGRGGEPLPGSIAEVRYLRLGGVEQWVMLRGENTANPPLILLHGGPGLGETALFRHYNAPLEKQFTLVYWDQRGAGKSADRELAPSSMTVEQLIEDLDELVDFVRDRLAQPRVILFGHSWGSLLGVLYAARFPAKVAAYVGSGQLGDWAESEAASYAYALGEAERRGNRKALAQLRRIGPPPYGAKAVFTERTWLARFAGQMKPRALWQLARVLLGAPESSVLELPGAWRAFRRAMNVMWPEVSRLNLLALAPALDVPVFFFLGRQDHWVPPETSLRYYERLRAPSKQLVWFERSGHEPFVDEADKFNAAMIDLVRSVAVMSGTGQRAGGPPATVGPWHS